MGMLRIPITTAPDMRLKPHNHNRITPLVTIAKQCPVSDVKMFKGGLFHNKSGDPDISYFTSPDIPLRMSGDVHVKEDNSLSNI